MNIDRLLGITVWAVVCLAIEVCIRLGLRQKK